MKINVKNEEKISKVIKEVENGCTARCFDESIGLLIKNAEKTLGDYLSIPKKYWQGCLISSKPPKVPQSYRYYGSAKGTLVLIERGSKDWFVVEAKRARCGNVSFGGNRRTHLILTSKAHEKIPGEYEI